jgi:hypothetical protein
LSNRQRPPAASPGPPGRADLPRSLVLDPVYTLERLVWRRYGDGWLTRPGADPVRSFHGRPTAEAAARDLEWDLRRRVNPFACGGPALHYQTSFDAARLFDWCLDHGLDPPGVVADSHTWSAWWAGHEPQFTDAQRAAVWEVLDRVRFYRVTESEPAEAMHLVALPYFENDPIPSIGWRQQYVGCTPYMLVRRPATADGLCRELHIDRVAERGAYYESVPADAAWVISERDPFENPRQDFGEFGDDPGVYAEHRSLSLVTDRPPTPGREVFVVLRRGWRVEEGGTGWLRWSPTSARTCGRPVIAFGTQAAADAHMARLEIEARNYPSPFRFGPPHEWGTLHAGGIWGTLSKMHPIVFTNQWSDYKASDRAWADWWDAAAPHLAADDVETVWSLYENLRFYEVVAVEFRE